MTKEPQGFHWDLGPKNKGLGFFFKKPKCPWPRSRAKVQHSILKRPAGTSAKNLKLQSLQTQQTGSPAPTTFGDLAAFITGVLTRGAPEVKQHEIFEGWDFGGGFFVCFFPKCAAGLLAERAARINLAEQILKKRSLEKFRQQKVEGKEKCNTKK